MSNIMRTVIIVLLAIFFTGCNVLGLSSTPTEVEPPPARPSSTQIELPPAKPSPTYPIPISPNNIFGYEYSRILEENGLKLMQEAGAEWVRRAGVWWPDVEPTKGSYDWSKLERFEEEFLRAHRSNMNVIIVVRGTPDWAQADPPYDRMCGRIRKEEFASFAKFLSELVERYSYAPYHVKYWEIWNEPDVDPSLVPAGIEWMGCWGELGDPYYGGGYYAELLKAIYPAIKAANPEVQVLVGGLLLDCDPVNVPTHKPDCNLSKFLEGILVNGGGSYFDAISFHAYDYNQSWLGGYSNSNWHSQADTTGPVLLAKAAYLKNLLARYEVYGKDLINTESALLCLNGDLSVCEMTKAYYVVHSYVSAYSVGLKANLWYFWMERQAGLFEADLTTLPSYDTFSFAQEQLTNAAYVDEVENFLPGVRCYEFTRGRVHFWVMWSLDGQRHLISLPFTPSAIFDAFGNSLRPSNSIEVEVMPLYIEWKGE